MASCSGVRAVCGALMAATGVTLITSVAATDDLVVSEQMRASDAGHAASTAIGNSRLLWSRQPGTSDVDEARGVATDEDGNVYVVGTTLGALGGRNKGGGDAWVTKFASDGRRLWSRQPGTSNVDFAQGVAINADGDVYVVGTTLGALGGRNKGGVDAWVIKFARDGRRLWSRQPGTSGEDEARGVATDEDGNAYLMGSTSGALGGPFKGVEDAWVIKFDGNGRRLWSRQPGTSDGDGATGVATDTDGNIYVVGTTFGALGGPNKGVTDAWLIKFDGHGRRLWSRQPGTSAADLARGVATHKDGNVYVVGQTLGALDAPNKGDVDAWVVKFERDGHSMWSRQPGTSDFDLANGVTTDTDGNVSVVGGSYGALGGANKGNEDAWVIKYAR